MEDGQFASQVTPANVPQKADLASERSPGIAVQPAVAGELDSETAADESWSADSLAVPPRTSLNRELRLLCVGPEEPDWIGLSLQLDAVGCVDPQMKWVSTASETMTLLRNESFHVIIISCDDPVVEDSAEPDWHPESLVDAIRASGSSDPVVLISTVPDDSLTNLACRHHCELLVSQSGWSSRALVNVLQRGIRQVDVQRENHHLAVANHRRLVRERDEADHLLDQQHGIIRELEALANGLSVVDADCQPASEAGGGTTAAGRSEARKHEPLPIPEQIKSYYHELLRTYVIMGSGNLGGEILQLAAVLAEVGLSPRDTLSLHLERVEQLVKGLGNRSTRHVLARADLLALELIIHLGECYQRTARPDNPQ
jgi:hypothetical protein